MDEGLEINNGMTDSIVTIDESISDIDVEVFDVDDDISYEYIEPIDEGECIDINTEIENSELLDDSESSDIFIDDHEKIEEIHNEDKDLFWTNNKDNDDSINENFDNSEFIERLKNDFGIPSVELKDLKPDYQEDIYNSIKEAYEKYPELVGQLREINCSKLNKRVFACYGSTKSDEPFGGVLNLNSRHFSKDSLPDDLKVQSWSRNFIPGASPGSIISHEMAGHGAHLDLCAKSRGIPYGEIPIKDDLRDTITDYLDDVHVKDIVESACADCGVKFGDKYFRNGLSNYAALNYGEAFAEAIAEQQNSKSPRDLSNAIHNRYIEYRNKVEKGDVL